MGTKEAEQLPEKVRLYMEKENMARPGNRILAGVSGGADSVCLLAVLLRLGKEYGWKIGAVHVNHGLRKEAGEDADFVEELCGRWGVPFFLKEEDVGKQAEEWRMSVEEAGRRVRYQAFHEAAERFGADRVAVAHNRSDRAETLLFHLFRGTGLKGMASIRPVRGEIIRPLLDTGREEIEDWLKKNGIAWRTDASNETDAYTRNRIRRQVLPYVEREICAEAGVHLAQAAQLLMQTSDFVERKARARLAECLAFEEERAAGLDVKAFLESEELLQGQMLKLLLERLSEGGRDIGQRHVQDVRTLFSRQSGRSLSLPGGLEARRDFGQVILRKKTDRIGEDVFAGEPSEAAGSAKALPGDRDLLEEIRENGSTSVRIPGMGTLEITLVRWEKTRGIEQKTYTKWLDYDKISKNLTVRRRMQGDYITVTKDGGRKKLKDFYINEKIPRDDRGNVWLIASGPEVLWAVGVRLGETCKISKETRTVLEIIYQGGTWNE